MPSTSTAAPRLLAQALTLPNGTVLRNRLAKAAMSETLGTYDNRPTPALSTGWGTYRTRRLRANN